MAKCREVAGDNVIFVGQLSHEDPLLASAFAAAKLFVLASYSEVMPLTLYEAATAGCNLAVSKNVPVSENIKQLVPVFNPDNPAEIAAVIDNEMEKERNVELQKRALMMPTWQDIGRQIYAIYDGVIQK
jgi:glycosyltransferase involved in cell wall biosynthesis